MAVWSQISTANLVGAIRLDAEFWQPKYLNKEQAIRAGEHINLGALVTTFKKGIFYILAREYAESGIPFFRSSNVGSVLPADEGVAFITEKKHSDEFKTALSAGDLMLVKTGKSGASVVLSESCNVSQDVVAVKVDRDKINPYYLAIFLNTIYGKSEMDRWFQGQVQPHLSLEDARRIWVTVAPIHIQSEVEGLVIAAADARAAYRNSWSAAHERLVSGLALDELNFNKPMGYTASFSALELSLRSDAQHFQPQFTQLASHLSKFPTRRIREIRHLNRRGIQPVYVEDGTHAVVNSQHLGPKHINYDGLQRTTAKLFNAAPVAHIRKDDLLIYTTGAYIGRTNVYLDDTPAFASNHVNILRLSPDIDHAYMAMVFQSVIGQFQTQKHARGSAQAELYPADIDKFVVPLLPSEKQREIGDLVRESLAQQRESARLLEQAKARVEQLIEEAVAT
jgi:restriction endonuclease S subunit